MNAMDHDDITLELARLEREALANVLAKLAQRQLGEAFKGLEAQEHDYPLAQAA
jgi:hypothetical protein